jgi:sugar phosphate isomerase/epimerase
MSSVNKVQIHVPYSMLVSGLEGFFDNNSGPEIYISAKELDNISPAALRRIRAIVESRGLSTTVHGPFMDLSPGAVDERVREVTVERFSELLKAAEYLFSTTVVLHADYDERRFDGDVDLWLAQSLKSWPALVKRAESLGIVIAVENVFEETPLPLKRLVTSVGSPNFRMCFDVGHFNIFSKIKMEEWFSEVGELIAEVHLHDNHGEFDEHLAVGDGDIDFKLFFRLLSEHAPNAVRTIEAHSDEILQRALKAIGNY